MCKNNTADDEKIMKTVYVKKDKSLEHFIFDYNKKFGEDAGDVLFKDIHTVNEKSFLGNNSLKRIFFKNSLETVKKDAFKNCELLEIFCCCSSNIKNDELKDTLCNINVAEIDKDFTVETAAFSCCAKLHTVIFPKCKRLVIEKSAFEGCSALRTVVAICDKISFTENPFADCPETLVFICGKNSEVERFARENGYRYINV